MVKPPLTPAFTAQNDNHGPKTVALLCGNDISALLAANLITRGLIDRGIATRLYFPRHIVSRKSDIQLPITQDFSFYERHLLNRVVIPFFGQRPPLLIPGTHPPKDLSFVPYHLEKLSDGYVAVEKIENVNNPDLVNKIVTDPKVVLTLSLRCYQKISKETIDKHDQAGKPLLNFHPGSPKHRGLFAPVRAIAARERFFVWMLHEIDVDFDNGPMIATTYSRWIDRKEPAIELYTGMVGEVADTFLHYFDILQEYGHTDEILGKEREKTPLYTYPTEQEYEDWAQLHPPVNYIDPHRIIDLYLKSFMTGTDPERGLLYDVLKTAVRAWQKDRRKMVYPTDFPETLQTRNYTLPRGVVDPHIFRREQ